MKRFVLPKNFYLAMTGCLIKTAQLKQHLKWSEDICLELLLMIRLFIALNIPAEIKNEIIRRRDQIISSVLENSENKIFTPLKWEPEEKLHLTLKFIGEVKEELLDKIIGSIGFIQNYKPIHCAFSGFGLFFRNNEPKILWAGFNVNKKLFELVNQLNKNFIKFSIQPEHRKFKAH